ncbi:hypothetical protein [Endozoicomonas sp. SCSIO W0465]|uniref:hypothetical protein n=1 Tax=Endozoicomonas sp. SCSIO W0465 TaxID=2918516 RepID=UPI0020753211|nr:hypothetical protein [Endozoicomonas sp. SCSIO W0465]USE35054.1 hypothetical protein MJO57_23510 [Endozoicomonas sp. SCSIO W0465]
MSFGVDGAPGSAPKFQSAAAGLSPKDNSNVVESGKSDSFRKFQPGTHAQPGRVRGFFQSLFGKPPETVETLIAKSSKSYAVKSEPPVSAEKKFQLAIDAQIAAFPYHRSLEKVASATEMVKSQPGIDPEVAKHLNFGQWDTARPLALDAAKVTGLSVKGSEGLIHDKKSGLTAYILHNPVTKEVRLVFGGTTSGESTGGLGKRALLNGIFSLNQWIANAKNAVLGKTPDSYEQARQLTQNVQMMVASDPVYNGFTFTVSGHSKGGGEAAYAALSLDKPVKAICFSSAELGKEMRDSIPEKTKAQAARYITHYNIQGDIVPNIGRVAHGLGHIGKVTTLPAEHSWNSPLDRHDKFTRHINNFVTSSTKPLKQ